MFRASQFRSWLPILIPGLVGAGVLWALLPPMVVVLDDDFWYLRSVVKTIWHGRPWTDEWLTPWSATTSTLSALIYAASGSFRLAINGSLVLMAGLAWAGFAWLHRDRGFRTGETALLGWLFFLFPTLLFMEMMFTSVALYWTALWWCLAFAMRGKWLGFFVVWALAVANRQSAVTWMAIPAWLCFSECLKTRFRPPYTRETVKLAAGVLIGGAWVIFLKLFMNPTMGQELALNHLDETQNLRHDAIPLGLALCAMGTGIGLGGMVTLVKRAEWPKLSFRRIALALLGAAIGIAAALWFRSTVTTTHVCFDVPGSAVVFGLLGAMSGGALGFSPPRLSLPFAWAALGSAVLVTYYGGKFDYYHAEIAFLAYSSVLAKFKPERTGYAAPGRRPVWAIATVAVLFLGFWNAACALRLKVAFEGGGAVARLYEKALRDGSLPPDQIGFAPFGYLGWRLQDHQIERNEIVALGGFMRYADAWDGTRGTSVLTRFPPQVKRWPEWFPTHNSVALREHPDGRDLASIKSPVLWNLPATFTLRRVDGAARDASLPKIDSVLYQPVPYPLSDAEWRDLIESKSFTKPLSAPRQ